MIKLLICDDQAVVRDGLSIMLNLAPDLEVIAVASNGREAVQLSATWQPDLILMDLKMPIMNGIEATRQISAAQPLVKILVLTTYDDDEWLFEAIRAGAAGYLLKDMAHSDLVSAIRGTVSGKAYVDPNVTARLLSQVATSRNQPPASQLTGRLTERELAAPFYPSSMSLTERRPLCWQWNMACISATIIKNPYNAPYSTARPTIHYPNANSNSYLIYKCG